MNPTGEVYILSSHFEALGIIDEINSVIWIERYYENGAVEIYAPATENNKTLLKSDNIAYIMNSNSPAVIEDVSIKDTEDGSVIIATGISADGMLDRRVFEALHQFQGTVGTVADQILDAYVFNPIDSNRAFFDMERGQSIESIDNKSPFGISVPDNCRTFITSIRGKSNHKYADSYTSYKGFICSFGEYNGSPISYALNMSTNSGASQSISMSHILRSVGSVYDELILDHTAKQAYIIRRVGIMHLETSDFTHVRRDTWTDTSQGKTAWIDQYKLTKAIDGGKIGGATLHQVGGYDSTYTSVRDYSVNHNMGLGSGPILDDRTFYYAEHNIADVAMRPHGAGYLLYELADPKIENISYIDIPDYFNLYQVKFVIDSTITSYYYVSLYAHMEGYYRVKNTEGNNPYIKGLSLEGSEKIDVQVTGDKVGSYLRELLKEQQAAIKARFNDDRSKLILDLYKGKDRSYDQQANPYVVFSAENDNLYNSEYTVKDSEKVNAVYTAGEGEGYLRTIVVIGDGAGWSRKEVFVDARDLSSKIDEDTTLSPVQYETVLRARGSQSIKKRGEYLNGVVSLTENYTYNQDFFLGDVVTIENRALNVYTNKRIIEITQVWDSNGYSIEPTFGD